LIITARADDGGMVRDGEPVKGATYVSVWIHIRQDLQDFS
jgi:hypothetical protein